MKDPDRLLRHLRPGEVDLAVVGPEVQDPVALAQRLHARDPDTAVLLVGEPAQQPRLAQAVRFSPFVGTDVGCRSTADLEGLALAAEAASQRARQRRTHRAMLAAAQVGVTAPRPAGPRPSEVLSRLLDLAPVGVAVVDAAGRVQAWNRTVAAFTGRAETDVLGLPLLDLVGEEEREALQRHIAAAAQGGTATPLPLRLATSEGERRLEVLAAPVEGAAGDGALVVLHDVTDRWRYQEALEREVDARTAELRTLARRHELLLQAAGDGIAGLDGDGKVTFANAAARRLLGGSRSLVGQAMHEVVHPRCEAKSTPSQWDCPLVQALRQGATRSGEDVFWHDDGTPLQVEYLLTPLQDSPGTGAVVLFRDIGERRRAEQAQRESAERLAEIHRLREMDAFRTRFINLAAHELNTPLTPLRLQMDLLKLKVAKEGGDFQGTLDVLDRNLDRLTQLVRDLLEAAKAQGGRLRVQPRPVDLAALARESANAFVESARQNGLHLEVALHEPLPVLADPQRLVQVLYNLLSNALKFTPPGGHVALRGFVVGERVRLEVEDTGRGFTEAQGARLFQPFTQVHEQDPSTTTTTGTGLGLYISRSILELQGGSLGASSAGPDQGALFHLELPLRRQATAMPQRPVHNP